MPGGTVGCVEGPEKIRAMSMTPNYYTEQNPPAAYGKEAAGNFKKKERPTRNKPTHLQTTSPSQTGKNMQEEKDLLFSRWCWESWTAACKRVIPSHHTQK